MKAIEGCVRFYCLFLSLSKSYLVEVLCTKKRMERADEVITANRITDFSRVHFSLIEEVLYLTANLEIDHGNVNARAMRKI